MSGRGGEHVVMFTMPVQRAVGEWRWRSGHCGRRSRVQWNGDGLGPDRMTHEHGRLVVTIHRNAVDRLNEVTVGKGRIEGSIGRS